jgi:two-component system cell cycle sensor histidine kinase/response regulator CckA
LTPAGIVAFLALRNFPLRALRRSEEALRRERDAAQRYLDVAGVLFVVLDESGRVSRLNRMGAEILGRTEADVVGREWLASFVQPADRERVASAMAAARGGEIVALEYAVVQPAGAVRIVSWYATSVAVDSGAGPNLLLSGVDVTRQRELEEQLRQTNRLRAIGQLAGGIAHDFNEVLAQIKRRAAVLRSGLELGNPHRMDADEILGAADRAAALTNSLLAFSRRQAMNPESIDLAELLRRSQGRMRRRLREEIALDLELPTRPLVVFADPGQIEQLLVNLVMNAQDAIRGAGQILVAASVVILDAEEARRAGPIAAGIYARVSVTDDGAGLEPETQARAFEPFFTTKAQGKGLGLAIAFGIVELHNGSIRIESAPGRGATITFLLPIRAGAEAAG